MTSEELSALTFMTSMVMASAAMLSTEGESTIVRIGSSEIESFAESFIHSFTPGARPLIHTPQHLLRKVGTLCVDSTDTFSNFHTHPKNKKIRRGRSKSRRYILTTERGPTVQNYSTNRSSSVLCGPWLRCMHIRCLIDAIASRYTYIRTVEYRVWLGNGGSTLETAASTAAPWHVHAS